MNSPHYFLSWIVVRLQNCINWMKLLLHAYIMHTLTFNYKVIKKVSSGAQLAWRYCINNYQLLETYMHSFKVS